MSTIPEHVEQQHRAEFLDLLYEKSGRTSGLYTGLWAEFCTERGIYHRHLHLLRKLQQQQSQAE
jgi:hypothetical protein